MKSTEKREFTSFSKQHNKNNKKKTEEEEKD